MDDPSLVEDTDEPVIRLVRDVPPWAPDDRAPDRELVTYVLDC